MPRQPHRPPRPTRHVCVPSLRVATTHPRCASPPPPAPPRHNRLLLGGVLATAFLLLYTSTTTSAIDLAGRGGTAPWHEIGREREVDGRREEEAMAAASAIGGGSSASGTGGQNRGTTPLDWATARVGKCGAVRWSVGGWEPVHSSVNGHVSCQ